MKIFQKTRKVAKKKSTQPKKQPQEVYARAAAPTVGKKKKRKRPDDEGLALGPLTARQRRCVAAAAAGAGLAVARRPDVRGVQAAQGKRRPRAERWCARLREAGRAAGMQPHIVFSGAPVVSRCASLPIGLKSWPEALNRARK